MNSEEKKYKNLMKQGLSIRVADGRDMYHLDPDKVLGIRVIPAHSPQAKGRGERYNGIKPDKWFSGSSRS